MSKPKVLLLPHTRVRKFGYGIFRALGVSKEISKTVVDCLVETSLRGVDSHGIRLIPHYLKAVQVGRIDKDAKFVFKKTAAAVGILNANHGFGIFAGILGMKEAIKMAKRNGISCVAVNNSNHFGALAIYTTLAAKEGMIGFAFTNTDSLVVPFFGKVSYLGTNPIAIAAPMKGEEPFSLDMATSTVSMNKVLNYKSLGIELEPGWAVDEKGKETLDPGRAIALLPLGNYKGYALACAVEMMAAQVCGAAFGKHVSAMYPLDKGKRNLGHLLMAIDVSKFRNLGDFKKEVRDMCEELRGSERRSKHQKVLVPGDPEKRAYKYRLKRGIPLACEQYNQLIDMAKLYDYAGKL